jgi:protease YdgD
MLRQKSLYSLIFTSFLILLPACGSRDSGSTLQNRFGEDNRIPLDRPDYPWRAIGKVFNAGCSGTMVGRDIVLTAAHCVVDPATKQIANNLTWFRPNYVNASAPVESWIEQIWTGTFDPGADRGHDWAVLRLREPIGDKVGWINVNPTDAINFPGIVTVAGYSADFNGGEVAGAHIDCNTRARFQDANTIFHDCDTARGSSGGPVLAVFNGSLVVVGVNVAEIRGDSDTSLVLSDYEDAHANVAIPSNGFFNLVRDLQAAAMTR